jgi:two-component system OmpR family sensor kinase
LEPEQATVTVANRQPHRRRPRLGRRHVDCAPKSVTPARSTARHAQQRSLRIVRTNDDVLPLPDRGLEIRFDDKNRSTPIEPSFPALAPQPAYVHRRRRIGTAARLAGFHALVLLVVLGAVVVVFVKQFATSYQTLAARALTSEMRAYVSAASARPATENLQTFTVQYLQQRALPAETVLVVSFPGAQIVGTTGSTELLKDPRVSSWLAHPPSATKSEATHVAGSLHALLVAPLLVGGVQTGTFLAATNLAADDGQRSRVLALSIAEAGIALIAGIASAYFLLRRLLRTVGRITTAAEEIGNGALDRRLGDQGIDDEVGQLANTFDAMLERIDTAMTTQRRLLSDVSHQLRTPLTVARGHLEVLQRTGDIADPRAAAETVALVVDELDHMRSLVERLLLLGRAMEPDFLAPDLIDARAFLADLYAASQVLAARSWTLSAVPDVVVCADAAKLRGALLNLIDNAVRVTTSGGRIEIACELDPVARTFSLAVEDSGPGIPAAQREAVLARFARPGARDQDGSGLGLAIVRAVAGAHGGTVSIGESRFGGARVAMVLPAELVQAVESV